MGDKQVFKIGQSGSEWEPLAKAARVAFPHLSPEDRLAVETIVMAHRPELDWAKKYWTLEKAGETAGLRDSRK